MPSCSGWVRAVGCHDWWQAQRMVSRLPPVTAPHRSHRPCLSSWTCWCETEQALLRLLCCSWVKAKHTCSGSNITSSQHQSQPQQISMLSCWAALFAAEPHGWSGNSSNRVAKDLGCSGQGCSTHQGSEGPGLLHPPAPCEVTGPNNANDSEGTSPAPGGGGVPAQP